MHSYHDYMSTWKTLQLKLFILVRVIIQVHDIFDITATSHEEAKLIQWFHTYLSHHL